MSARSSRYPDTFDARDAAAIDAIGVTGSFIACCDR